MRFAICTVFYCSLFAAATYSQSSGSEPSPVEAVASRQGVRTTWSSEIVRWQQHGTRFVVVAVVLEDDSQPARKIQRCEDRPIK